MGTNMKVYFVSFFFRFEIFKTNFFPFLLKEHWHGICKENLDEINLVF